MYFRKVNMMKKPKITVIGSINMDLVTKTNTIPKVGETVIGESYFTIPGGKGANQAVAAARLGAEVTLVGCVGDDSFGSELKSHLAQQNVNTDYIKTISDTSTGIAAIYVGTKSVVRSTQPPQVVPIWTALVVMTVGRLPLFSVAY